MAQEIRCSNVSFLHLFLDAFLELFGSPLELPKGSKIASIAASVNVVKEHVRQKPFREALRRGCMWLKYNK